MTRYKARCRRASRTITPRSQQIWRQCSHHEFFRFWWALIKCSRDLQERAKSLPAWQQKLGKQLLLRRVGQAYGRMLLGPGLFQADCHPGNILVTDAGVVGGHLCCILPQCLPMFFRESHRLVWVY